MGKAFLSHNNIDKDFVLEVGRKLGYSDTIMDSFHFNEGEDFRNQIQDYLKESDLFVLFASKKSLKAPWVKYEINLAELFILSGDLSNVLVFLLDDASHQDLPLWLQNSLVKHVDNPKIAATTIKSFLETKRKDSLYIGRGAIQNKFDTDYFAADYNARNIMIHGIPGIGRRTCAKNIVKNTFSLTLSTEYKLEETEPLISLYRDLLIDFHEISSVKQFSEYKNAFSKLTLTDQTVEIVKYLNKYAEHRQVPVFIDDTKNGVLNKEGTFNNDILELLKQINNTDKLFSVFILQRNVKDFINKKFYFSIYIPELTLDFSEHLLKQYCNLIYNIEISKENARSISEYVGGYPPTIELASFEINQKGVDIVKNRPQYLQRYTSKACEEYIDKYVFTQPSGQILKYLNNFNNELPLAILEELEPDCLETLNYLLDVNIIKVRHETNTYHIVEPLLTAVTDRWGILTKKEYSQITLKLKKRFWNDQNLVNSSIINTIITSLLRSENSKTWNELEKIIIPSDIFKAARKAYGDKNWKTSLNLFRQLLRFDPQNVDALVYLIRCKIRLNEYVDNDLALLKPLDRDQYDLVLAFKLVQENSFVQAIKLLETIKKKTYFPPYVYRELGECYFQIGEYENVQDIITESMRKQKNHKNGYMLDLAAKNAIKIEKYSLAEEYITLLEEVDDIGSVSHRKATLYFKQDLLNKALEQSEMAVNSRKPRLEFYLLKANILLDLDRMDEAFETFNLVEKNYSTTNIKNDDGFNRLKCIYYIKKGNIPEAESILKTIPDNKKTYLSTRLLQLKIQDPNINLLEKERLKKDLETLEKNIDKKDIDLIDI